MILRVLNLGLKASLGLTDLDVPPYTDSPL